MDAQVLTIKDCQEDMLKDLRTGFQRGTTTYFPEFDNAWTWRPGELNLVTGMANEGKSLFLKQLCMIKYLAEGKKFIFASPEDFPAKSFFDDMIHTLAGKSTDMGRLGAISEEEFRMCMDRLSDGFYFLHIKPPDNTIPNVLDECRKIIEKEYVGGIIIDPILKFNRPPGAPERDDIYAAYLTMLLTEFARETNISTFLVLHQLTPRKNGRDLYDKPSMYQIKMGGSFADGADNVLFVWRPMYAKDKIDPTVVAGSLKIKKQKLTGVPQDIEFSFDRRSNRYVYKDSMRSVFPFDKYKLK